MATYNKFDFFVEDMARKGHNLNSDVLKLALSNVAPVAATNRVLADITQIASTGGYAPVTVAATGATQTAGVLKLLGNDTNFLAVAVDFAAFRYVVLYNDSSTGKMLIGWWDRGAALTLLAGETFIADLDQVNGILTVT